MLEKFPIFDVFDEQIEPFFQNIPQKNEQGLKYGTKLCEFKITIQNEKKYRLKQGKYVIVNCSKMFLYLCDVQKYVTHLLKKHLKKFFRALKIDKKSLVLVVGLGNRGIVCDSLGTKVTSNLFCSQNFPNNLKEELGNLCFLNCGVGGVTGISSFLVTKSVCDSLKPDLIILVDTLSTKDEKRLGVCFQISNAGITPGAGADNPQKSFDEFSLNHKVLAIGVPFLFSSKTHKKTKIENLYTLKDVDLYIEKCSKIISEAINETVHGIGYKKYV